MQSTYEVLPVPREIGVGPRAFLIRCKVACSKVHKVRRAGTCEVCHHYVVAHPGTNEDGSHMCPSPKCEKENCGSCPTGYKKGHEETTSKKSTTGQLLDENIKKELEEFKAKPEALREIVRKKITDLREKNKENLDELRKRKFDSDFGFVPSSKRSKMDTECDCKPLKNVELMSTEKELDDEEQAIRTKINSLQFRLKMVTDRKNDLFQYQRKIAPVRPPAKIPRKNSAEIQTYMTKYPASEPISVEDDEDDCTYLPLFPLSALQSPRSEKESHEESETEFHTESEREFQSVSEMEFPVPEKIAPFSFRKSSDFGTILN